MLRRGLWESVERDKERVYMCTYRCTHVYVHRCTSIHECVYMYVYRCARVYIHVCVMCVPNACAEMMRASNEWNVCNVCNVCSVCHNVCNVCNMCA